MTNSEGRKRLPPVTATLRELYLYSGNQCAYPNCANALLLNEGAWDCNVAHIYGVKESAARGEHNLSNEELRAPENLLLVCQRHHTVLDHKPNEKKYTVQYVQDMKSNHEKRFREAISSLERIVDTTIGDAPKRPTNLKKLDELVDHDVSLEQNINDMEPFFKLISEQPPSIRDLIKIILFHGKIGDVSWKETQVSVSASQILGVTQLSKEQIVWRAQHLEHAGLLTSYEEDGLYFFTLVDPTADNIGWDLFADLKKLSQTDSNIINRAIDSLDFTVFDA